MVIIGIGNILEVRDQQLLDLFQKSKINSLSLLNFLQNQLQFYTDLKSLQERALNHDYEIKLINVSVEEIIKKIATVLSKAELFNSKKTLVEGKFQIKTTIHYETGNCKLCNYLEPNRITYEIINVISKKKFYIDNINLHSIAVHHNFSYLGSNSHWNVEPYTACVVLEIRTQEEIDAISTSPKI